MEGKKKCENCDGTEFADGECTNCGAPEPVEVSPDETGEPASDEPAQ